MLHTLQSPFILLLACVIDFTLGEPPTRLHPVVWIGRLTRSIESRLPRNGPQAWLSGVFVALFVPALALSGVMLALWLTRSSPLVMGALAVWLLTSSFSARMLAQEAAAVFQLLRQGQLDEARARLSHLCSRDTKELTTSEVSGAVIESVAENTSDSVVAPLFWFCLLGLPGAILFRSVNTLDGMIGYRGEYELLGKASARFDDLLCWIPARLTGLLFLVAGQLAGRNVRKATRVLLKYRNRTESPNAGYPMSAMAGLLGVCLSKRSEYELGSSGREPQPKDIGEAIKLFWVTALLATGLVLTATILMEPIA